MAPSHSDPSGLPAYHPLQLESDAVRPSSAGRAPRLLSQPVGLPQKAIPPGLESGPSAAVLLKGLRRHLGLALGLGLFCAGLVAVITWYVLPTAKYTARSMLFVAATPPKVVFNDTDRNLDTRTEHATYKQTQEVLIKSPFVLLAAVRQPQVIRLPSIKSQIDPIEWLAGRLKVEFTGEVAYISLGGNNPSEITELVNAVTKAYITEVVNAEHNLRLERYSKLKDLHAKYTHALKDKRDKLKKLAEYAGSNDKTILALKHQMEVNRLNDAHRDLSQVRSDLRKAEMELKRIQHRARAPKPVMPQAEIEVAINNDPAIMADHAEIKKLEARLKEYEYRVRKGNDPSIVKTKTQIKEKQQALAKVRANLRADYLKQALASGDEGTGALDEATQTVNLLKGWETNAVEEVNKLTANQTTITRTTMDLEALQDEIQHAETTMKQVGAQTEILNVELEAPKRVRLLALAEVPKVINLTKHIAATGFTGLCSLAAVLLGVAFWETRAQRLDTVDQVVKGLGMDLVGVLPALPGPSRNLPARKGSREVQEQVWNHILLESVDAMRAMILHTSRTESLKVLMVASALKGEGKTSLACHLATSLARARRRTLLIDCDLRSPAVHRMFDVLSEPGICELLRSQATIADAIQPTIAQGLSILPAGRCDALAIQALAQGCLQALFEDLKAQYDYIIVDSAPVLPVADSLQVCQHVDAVVFSVLRDVTRLPKLYAAYERLATLGVRMLGAVVAGTRCEDYASSYAYNISQAESARS